MLLENNQLQIYKQIFNKVILENKQNIAGWIATQRRRLAEISSDSSDSSPPHFVLNIILKDFQDTRILEELYLKNLVCTFDDVD